MHTLVLVDSLCNVHCISLDWHNPALLLIKCACEFNSYGEYEYMYCKLKLIPIFMALFKINRPITQIF